MIKINPYLSWIRLEDTAHLGQKYLNKSSVTVQANIRWGEREIKDDGARIMTSRILEQNHIIQFTAKCTSLNLTGTHP